MIAPPIYQTEIVRPLPEKEIFWSGARAQGGDVDRRRFPLIRDIQSCPQPPKGQPLAEFVAEVRQARERVFILDDFLFYKADSANLEDRLDQILAWFPIGFSAPRVQLLTTSRGTIERRQRIRDRIAEHEAMINQDAYVQVTITSNFNLNRNFDHIHDRFAIIDDDLWHFGATVGGLHWRLNAATRGWPAEQHGAVQFFEDVWTECLHEKASPKRRNRR